MSLSLMVTHLPAAATLRPLALSRRTANRSAPSTRESSRVLTGTVTVAADVNDNTLETAV